VTADAVQALARTIPAGQAEIVPHLGHLPCLEIPQRLAARIAAFDPGSLTRAETGTQMRRAVLGDEHVDKALLNVTPLDQSFQTLVTEGAWGTVWSNLDLSVRERSMLTLALLAATGNFEEIPMHIRATSRTGATLQDIAQAFQHVAIYAGVPRANHALKLAKQTLAEIESSDG